MDFYNEFDLVPQLTDEFYGLLESKKWSERKEPIDKLVGILDKNPKIAPNDSAFHQLVDVLVKILAKDSNIMVAASAAQLLTRLARGLGNKFEIHAPGVISTCLLRLKETKPVVKEPCTECIAACYETTTFANVIEPIKEAIVSKFPGTKVAACDFFKTCMLEIDFATAKKSSGTTKEAIDNICKLAVGSDATCRDVAMQALAAFMRAVGKPIALPLIQTVQADKLKFAKVEEYFDQFVVEFPLTNSAAPAKPAAAAPAKKGVRPGQKPAKPEPEPVSEPEEEYAPPASAPRKQQSNGSMDFYPEFDLVPQLTDEFYGLLEDKKWSERKEPLDKLVGILDKNPKIAPNDSAFHQLVDVLVKMLAKDSNIMVAASSAQLLTRLARGLGNKFEIHAPGVISTCLLRLKEAKPVVKEPCTGCITACYETTTFANVIEPIKEAIVSKFPGTKVAACEFFKTCMLEIDFTTAKKSAATTKEAIDNICKLALGSDAACRDIAMQGLAAFMRAVGKPVALPLIQTVQVDKLKFAKVEEYHAQFIIEFPPVNSAAPAKPAAALAKKVVRPGQKPAKPEPEPVSENRSPSPEPEEEYSRPATPPRQVETPLVRQMKTVAAQPMRQMSDILASCASMPLESVLNLTSVYPRKVLGDKTVAEVIDKELSIMEFDSSDPRQTLKNALKSLQSPELTIVKVAVVELLGLVQDPVNAQLLTPKSTQILQACARSLQDCVDIIASNSRGKQQLVDEFCKATTNFLIRFVQTKELAQKFNKQLFELIFTPLFDLFKQDDQMIKAENKQSIKVLCMYCAEFLSFNYTFPILVETMTQVAMEVVAEEQETSETDIKKSKTGRQISLLHTVLYKACEVLRAEKQDKVAEGIDFMAHHRKLAPLTLLILNKKVPPTSPVKNLIAGVTQRVIHYSLIHTLPCTVHLAPEYPEYASYAMKCVNALFTKDLTPQKPELTIEKKFESFTWRHLEKFAEPEEYDTALKALYVPYKIFEWNGDASFTSTFKSVWDNCFKCSVFEYVVTDLLQTFDEACKENKTIDIYDHVFTKHTTPELKELYKTVEAFCTKLYAGPNLFAHNGHSLQSSKSNGDEFNSKFLKDMRRYSSQKPEHKVEEDENTQTLFRPQHSHSASDFHTPKRGVDDENTMSLFNSKTIVKKRPDFVKPIVKLDKTSMDFVNQQSS